MIRATGKRVIVRERPALVRSVGGLHLVERYGDPSADGDVVSSGVEEVEVGQRVMVKPYGGKEIQWEGKKYRVLEESEILGVIL